MGSLILPIDVPAGRTEAFAYRRVDSGRLYGLTVSCLTDDIRYGQALCQVGIMRDGRGSPFINQIFISDMVSTNFRPFWQGEYRFQTTDELFVRSIADAAVTLRVGMQVIRAERAGD